MWLKRYLNRIYDESDNVGTYAKQRIDLMNSTNPRFILRNHLAQDCIDSVDKNNFVDSRVLLKILENPFSTEPIENLLKEMDLDEAYKEG